MLRAKLACGAVLGALEEHVLENVREARAEVLVLVDAAGLAPCLEAGDGGGVVFLYDDGEAVREGPDAGIDGGDGDLGARHLSGLILGAEEIVRT